MEQPWAALGRAQNEGKIDLRRQGDLGKWKEENAMTVPPKVHFKHEREIMEGVESSVSRQSQS